MILIPSLDRVLRMEIHMVQSPQTSLHLLPTNVSRCPISEDPPKLVILFFRFVLLKQKIRIVISLYRVIVLHIIVYIYFSNFYSNIILRRKNYRVVMKTIFLVVNISLYIFILPIKHKS